MAVVKITIDGKDYQAEEGENLLSFLLKNHFPIPHLCFHPDFEPEQACRLCLVEVNGKVVTSCAVKITNGLNILTNSEKIKKLRIINSRLLNLTQERKKNRGGFTFSQIINFNNQKCIDCGLCIKTCQNQNINAIDFRNYGIDQEISPTGKPCVFCGQCLTHCPVNAIFTDEEEYQRIKKTFKEKKIKIAQIAPSVRASLGELFDIPYEEVSAELVVAGLKKLGFDYVFDTALGADFTTYEEAKELVLRIKEGGFLPMLTSCCAGWVKYVKDHISRFLPYLTSTLPPEIILGNLIKHYFVKKMGFNLEDVYLVSIMPCTAKKWEIKRKELLINGISPVDDVLTTVEAGRFLKEEGVDLKNLTPVNFDSPLGETSGAGIIYGVTGGVMTSALRSAYFFLNGRNPENLYFKEEMTDFKGVKIFEVNLEKIILKTAVVTGLGNFQQIANNLEEFHYIEVMACPGGCLAGGGQPKPVNDEIRKKRKEVLIRLDKEKTVRFAHENPVLKKIYEEFLNSNQLPICKLSI